MLIWAVTGSPTPSCLTWVGFPANLQFNFTSKLSAKQTNETSEVIDVYGKCKYKCVCVCVCPAGCFQDASVIQCAYNLNHPLRLVPNASNLQLLSAFSVSADGVILETIKQVSSQEDRMDATSFNKPSFTHTHTHTHTGPSGPGAPNGVFLSTKPGQESHCRRSHHHREAGRGCSQGP